MSSPTAASAASVASRCAQVAARWSFEDTGWDTYARRRPPLPSLGSTSLPRGVERVSAAQPSPPMASTWRPELGSAQRLGSSPALPGRPPTPSGRPKESSHEFDARLQHDIDRYLEESAGQRATQSPESPQMGASGRRGEEGASVVGGGRVEAAEPGVLSAGGLADGEAVTPGEWAAGLCVDEASAAEGVSALPAGSSRQSAQLVPDAPQQRAESVDALFPSSEEGREGVMQAPLREGGAGAISELTGPAQSELTGLTHSEESPVPVPALIDRMAALCAAPAPPICRALDGFEDLAPGVAPCAAASAGSPPPTRPAAACAETAAPLSPTPCEALMGGVDAAPSHSVEAEAPPPLTTHRRSRAVPVSSHSGSPHATGSSSLRDGPTMARHAARQHTEAAAADSPPWQPRRAAVTPPQAAPRSGPVPASSSWDGPRTQQPLTVPPPHQQRAPARQQRTPSAQPPRSPPAPSSAESASPPSPPRGKQRVTWPPALGSAADSAVQPVDKAKPPRMAAGASRRGGRGSNVAGRKTPSSYGTGRPRRPSAPASSASSVASRSSYDSGSFIDSGSSWTGSTRSSSSSGSLSPSDDGSARRSSSTSSGHSGSGSSDGSQDAEGWGTRSGSGSDRGSGSQSGTTGSASGSSRSGSDSASDSASGSASDSASDSYASRSASSGSSAPPRQSRAAASLGRRVDRCPASSRRSVASLAAGAMLASREEAIRRIVGAADEQLWRLAGMARPRGRAREGRGAGLY